LDFILKSCGETIAARSTQQQQAASVQLTDLFNDYDIVGEVDNDISLVENIDIERQEEVLENTFSSSSKTSDVESVCFCFADLF
jgi:hypothetical protein